MRKFKVGVTMFDNEGYPIKKLNMIVCAKNCREAKELALENKSNAKVTTIWVA